jgi:hypothetical protein
LFVVPVTNFTSMISESSKRVERFDCIIPVVRDPKKEAFVQEEVKFSFDAEHTAKKTIVKKNKEGAVESETTESSTELRTKKVQLKTYGKTANEDAEHFFIAFERMRTVLKKEWSTASTAKANDAQILFDAFDAMLTGTANAEWHDVLEKKDSAGNIVTKRDWETFKTRVATYITSKVVSTDAYNRQVTYMTNRPLPDGLFVDIWYARLQTMSRSLPYMFENLEEFKKKYPDKTFKDWWILGGLTDDQEKQIILTKVPGNW